MEPFNFGRPDEPLFGIHHPPTSGRSRAAGVLLCYPIGHEYIVAHRAYRQLAIRLAEAGFHVLRFDYHASGDSAGDCEQGSPARWLRDVSTAIGEIRLRSAASNVCLVGSRFGATLSVLVGAERGDIEHMVLWDPIACGKSHLDELMRRHHEMLQRTHVQAGPKADGHGTRELLGFAVTEAMLLEIEAVRLLDTRQPPAADLLLIESGAATATSPLKDHLLTLGSRVTYHRIPVPNAWTWIEDINTVLVPNQILNVIASWVMQAHP